MHILNRISGSIIGAFNGLVTAATQIPYGFYVIAQNMRDAGYSWRSTVAIATSLSPLWLVAGLLFSVSQAWAIIALGIKIGWIKGIVGGFKLPATLHTQFQTRRDINRKIYLENTGITGKLFFDLGAICVAPVFNLLDSNILGEFYIPSDEQNILFLIEENRLLDTESQFYRLCRQAIEANNPDLALQYYNQAQVIHTQRLALYTPLGADDESLAIQQNNTHILERITNLEKMEQGVVLPLSEDEITALKKAMTDMPFAEKNYYTNILEKYEACNSCPISLEWSSNPLTVVLSDTSEKVYEHDVLINAIQNNTRNNIIAFEPTSRENLMNLQFYKGYPPFMLTFIQEVRETIKKSKALTEAPQHFPPLHQEIPATAADKVELILDAPSIIGTHLPSA